MLRLAFFLAATAALAACSESNPQSCALDENKNKAECSGQGSGTDSGPEKCTQATDCSGDLGVCDTGKDGGTCVQCTAADKHACMGDTPVCDASDTCRACVADGECGAGGLCRPDGSCATADNIIRAIATGGSTDAATCGAASGMRCTLDTALDAAKASSTASTEPKRNVIQLDTAGMYKSAKPNFVVDVDKAFDLIIDARGADIIHNAEGAILTVGAGKGVTVLGGTIEGATGDGTGSHEDGNGILCNGGTLTLQGTTVKGNREAGISASTCTLVLTKAVIRDHSGGVNYPGILASSSDLTVSKSQFISNKGGGITATMSKFVIVGNVFINNGDSASTIGGGISVTSTLLSGNRIEFNSLMGNKATGTNGSGIQCSSAELTASNNILWENQPNNIQVSGVCKHAYSDIGPPMLTVLDGGHNNNDNPLLNGADLSVPSNSPVKGKADPSADITGIAATDIGGRTRVKDTTTNGADIGAYVVPAP